MSLLHTEGPTVYNKLMHAHLASKDYKERTRATHRFVPLTGTTVKHRTIATQSMMSLTDTHSNMSLIKPGEMI